MDEDRPQAPIDEVIAFETATRDLVGVALRSVERLDVSLSQFRLLLVLHEHGPSSSVACARALGVVGSSVTRLADRLHASGHLLRGADPANRSAVTLRLTDVGRRVVQEVTDRRRRELSEAIGSLDPAERAACARALRSLHRSLDGTTSGDELHRNLPF
ncbi:MarR family transcriptional regulator [Gordonia sp. HY285]|uniref:MarR family winged helix-turn-helix transcriptional regulator n=1 Tax=Gordonia liuliyuniae TaxID=2911517 RepID=UPI001F00F422|nr:MarR family transcriptional regulator [Gordonia liuliyuniae]MCF8610117.1 MarR family transcriptional regulator [Gordonia liuliyuniae]